MKQLTGLSDNADDNRWNEGLVHLAEYKAAHGHCRVPGFYIAPDGYLLGVWLAKQRRAFIVGKLEPLHLQRLNAIEVDLKSVPNVWEIQFNHLTTYYMTYGHSDVPYDYVTNDGYPLGTWLATQKRAYKKGSLSSDRTRRLNTMGVVWDALEASWREGYSHLKQFRDLNGHANVLGHYKCPDGYGLGAWLARQRSEFKKGKCTPEHIRLLECIDIVWDVHDTAWEAAYQHLTHYRNVNGHCNVPANYVTQDTNYSLGQWLNEQRHAYNKNSYPAERLHRMNELGVVWSILDKNWDEGFGRLKNFISDVGHSNVPTYYETSDGFPLGLWLHRKRQSHRKGKLAVERFHLLDDLGVTWNVKETNWQAWFDLLRRYHQVNGHCNVPENYLTDDGHKLGVWLMSQRAAFSKGSYARDRLEQMNSLGMIWVLRTTRWKDGFDRIKQYLKEHGDCSVPYSYKCSDGYALGAWLTRQRRAFRLGNLSAVHWQKLRDLGVVP